MTAHPYGPAGRLPVAAINRVVKFTVNDSLETNPDTLLLVKREVNTLDLLEVSDPSTWSTRIASITDVKTKRMFEGGATNRIYARYFVYGLSKIDLESVLGNLFRVNYGKVSGWLRLSASTAVAGEWSTIVDVLNPGSPVTQVGAVRKPAVGASANGFPTMVFDGTDVILWPVSPAHTSRTKLGFIFWYKPATVVGTQMLYAVTNGVAGAANRRISIFASGATVACVVYLDNFNGRVGQTGNVLTVGNWSPIYIRYDSSLGGDPNIAIFVNNNASQTLTYSNDGAGGTIGQLTVASGSATMGGGTDSDTPSSPIANGGMLGPNTMTLIDTLTPTEITNTFSFEVPVG